MNPALYYISLSAAIFVYITGWSVYGEKTGRLDVADEAWGLAQPVIVIVCMSLAKNFSVSSFLLLAMTSIWGYRLFHHLHKRHAISDSEDSRYAEMRASWTTHPKIKSFVYVFLLQGILMYLLGIASMILVNSNADLNPLSLIGVALWIFGFIFEVIADNQLKDFIKDPVNKGRIMNKGLWRFSRHPNYFGEIIMWLGIFIFAFINYSSIWMIISPLTISYLIIFVSGIPMTEKHFENNPLWKAYKDKTSPLVPWPNKK